jgi:DNA-directed RNA polymerase specialized sigma24 family protein
MQGSIFQWFSKSEPCDQFATHQLLFDALARCESAAIMCIQLRAIASVQKIASGYGLQAGATEEILNQATVIFLKKIDSADYQFRGHSPVTYLVEIAKRLALMATRSRKKDAYDTLENLSQLPDTDIEVKKEQAEATELVRHLLTKIGEPCQTVIRKYHIEGYSDEELVKSGQTAYTTINSLKMKRSDCMKKLIKLATEWRSLENI